MMKHRAKKTLALLLALVMLFSLLPLAALADDELVTEYKVFTGANHRSTSVKQNENRRPFYVQS